MKLIIDIPKNAYDLLQCEGVDWLGAEHILDAVAKGIPLSESEDCVSREDILKMQYRINDSATLSARNVINVEDIEDLPPVTPKQRVGQWIKTKAKGGMTMPCCSLCGNETGTIYEYDYCPNCGAKMGGEQNEVSD